MFVKIIRNKRESLFPCINTDYEVINYNAIVTIHQITGEILTEEVQCIPENIIYFMNDFGRTVDRKIWSNTK